MASDEGMQQRLQELQKQLGKKQTFEESVSAIRSLLKEYYSSASPKLRKSIVVGYCLKISSNRKKRRIFLHHGLVRKEKAFFTMNYCIFMRTTMKELKFNASNDKRRLDCKGAIDAKFYNVVCRVATILKTRYTSLGFWMAGLNLFEEARQLASDESERKHLQSCIDQAREQLGEVENAPDDSRSSERRSRGGYLFEGHLTVDREPPQPDWLVQSNLLTAAAALLHGESSGGQMGNAESVEGASNLLQDLFSRFDDIVPEILDIDSGVPKAPPASKEVVAKLPVTTVTEDFLTKLGKDAVCSICQENLILDDKMQELPCKHMFHPPCLKPWLDEHNSCPICRHELKTDDHSYESWKEREKEAEEDRKGAANAVRGGEYMYV